MKRDRLTIIRQILTICKEPDVYKWQMQRELEMSHETLTRHLNWLIEHGHLERHKGVNFIFAITTKGRKFLESLRGVEGLLGIFIKQKP
jgi:predicted transcriptional regulator